jgi:hypothetical protein
MIFGSMESGKGTEVGEGDHPQCGLMGAFECIEPFDEQPLGNARAPGLPRRETARRRGSWRSGASAMRRVLPMSARLQPATWKASDAAARPSARLWIA